MHNIGFFSKMRYADNLQLVWSIIDTGADIYVYVFPTSDCRDHQVSFIVEFTHCIIMHTIIVLFCWQVQACICQQACTE